MVTFFTAATTSEEVRQANLLIGSLRRFGGALCDNPVWLFLSDMGLHSDLSDPGGTEVFPLDMAPGYRRYPLAEKVIACAQAEAMAGAKVRSLVWLNLDCLITNPPELFDLGPDFDAALRPVHIRNVGSLASEPPDDYWQTVYQKVGVEDAPYTIESFVDAQTIRPYFNTHCFSINPAKGILKAWREHFVPLVEDKEFQNDLCQDDLHRIFLHQAVLSALIMRSIEQKRICLLSPGYSYPLHLQEQLPPHRRVQSLSQVVCMVYEDTTLLDGIEIPDPVKSWLQMRQSD